MPVITIVSKPADLAEAKAEDFNAELEDLKDTSVSADWSDEELAQALADKWLYPGEDGKQPKYTPEILANVKAQRAERKAYADEQTKKILARKAAFEAKHN